MTISIFKLLGRTEKNDVERWKNNFTPSMVRNAESVLSIFSYGLFIILYVRGREGFAENKSGWEQKSKEALRSRSCGISN